MNARTSLTSPTSYSSSGWYVDAMKHLVDVVQELSYARALDDVLAIVRKAARDLTGADGATFVLREGDYCYYAEENAIAPLWKGQRFPMSLCISGWVMTHAQTVYIEDIYADSRIPHNAYKPTFVKSLAMVPIRKDSPIGAIGNYWASTRKPAHEEMSLLESLANVTAVAMENVGLYKQLQEKVRALEESNHELSRFAWVASHDLKSPLRAIDNLCSWIEEDMGEKLSTESEKNFHALRGRVVRMERLLDDVLAYAQLEQNTQTDDSHRVTCADIIGDIVALLDVPAGFTVDVTPACKNTRLPRMPLQHVLYNLLDNAIKHHDSETGRIHIDFKDDDIHYIFTISDDGPGIPPEYHQKVFDMFETLKPRDKKEGSGMGLAFAKKTLARQGGSIAIQSGPAPARGTTFTVTLPKPVTDRIAA